ncbi:hypothetical protein GCM10008014_09550 [Paenibacillus silvae]|uniref:Uncharacterized protein n=1 Tax=Paenibacillus silvae TaxID=1325358 RepID=A0ABQ1Z4F9_9BACL|nr:hypothetical protein GCM10008014_09550 [Paenibacillus silvae]
MTILSTGPIENNAVSGVRPTKQVTIRIVSRVATRISAGVCARHNKNVVCE